MTEQDRRLFPRIDDEGLSLRLEAGDFDTTTHTLNVSASGIYCKVDKEIPLMSRVKLMLMLPAYPKEEKASSHGIEVGGVVVRQHPVIIDGVIKHYDVAIFFDDLAKKDRDVILNYISVRKKS